MPTSFPKLIQVVPALYSWRNLDHQLWHSSPSPWIYSKISSLYGWYPWHGDTIHPNKYEWISSKWDYQLWVLQSHWPWLVFTFLSKSWDRPLGNILWLCWFFAHLWKSLYNLRWMVNPCFPLFQFRLMLLGRLFRELQRHQLLWLRKIHPIEDSGLQYLVSNFRLIKLLSIWLLMPLFVSHLRDAS